MRDRAIDASPPLGASALPFGVRRPSAEISRPRFRLGPHLAAALFVAPAITNFLIAAFVGAAQPNVLVLAALTRLEGVLAGLPFLGGFVAVVFKKVALRRIDRSATRQEQLILGIAWSACFVFTAYLALSIVARSSIYYIVGDYYRSVLPFLALIVLFRLYPLDEAEVFATSLIRQFALLAVVLAVLGAAWKAAYVWQGVLYGSGLRQYYMGSFVLSVFLLKLGHGNLSLGRRLVTLFLLVMMLALSVLSMKRGVWAAIAVTMALIFVASNRKMVQSALAIFILATLLAIGASSGYMKNVAARYESTFSQEAGFDRSTQERINEAKGAMYTLRQFGSPLVYAFGLGHGAEFRTDPTAPLAKTKTGSQEGSYHHIHSTFYLLLFRYGIIGLILYAAVSIPIMQIIRRLLKTDMRSFALAHPLGNICVAMAVAVCGSVFQATQKNVFYGSSGYAVSIYILVASFTITRRRLG